MSSEGKEGVCCWYLVDELGLGLDGGVQRHEDLHMHTEREGKVSLFHLPHLHSLGILGREDLGGYSLAERFLEVN